MKEVVTGLIYLSLSCLIFKLCLYWCLYVVYRKEGDVMMSICTMTSLINISTVR